MNKVINNRMFAKHDGEFVVFLIGMRINSFLKINKWLPVSIAMPKMLKELYTDKDSGFLGAEMWFGRTTIMVQYWKSFEHLESYAKDRNKEHFPAWKSYNQKVRKTNAVGVWHETYKAGAGTYENIYINMPAFGLGKASKLIPVSEKYEEAGQRIQKPNTN